IGCPSQRWPDDTASGRAPASALAVLATLRRALADTRVVMVASRPSTVPLADDALFVDRGRSVAHGTRDRLMREVGPYRDLIEAFEADRAAPTGSVAQGVRHLARHDDEVTA